MTNEEIYMNLMQKMIHVSKNGGSFEFTQEDALAYFEMAQKAAEMLKPKPTIGLDEFPSILDGDKEENSKGISEFLDLPVNENPSAFQPVIVKPILTVLQSSTIDGICEQVNKFNNSEGVHVVAAFPIQHVGEMFIKEILYHDQL